MPEKNPNNRFVRAWKWFGEDSVKTLEAQGLPVPDAKHPARRKLAGSLAYASVAFYSGIPTALIDFVAYNTGDETFGILGVAATGFVIYAGKRGFVLSRESDRLTSRIPRPLLVIDQKPLEVSLVPVETDLVERFAAQLESKDIDLEQRVEARAWLQRVHDITGRALDLLRPAQGTTRPNTNRPADSGPKYNSP